MHLQAGARHQEGVDPREARLEDPPEEAVGGDLLVGRRAAEVVEDRRHGAHLQHRRDRGHPQVHRRVYPLVRTREARLGRKAPPGGRAAGLHHEARLEAFLVGLPPEAYRPAVDLLPQQPRRPAHLHLRQALPCKQWHHQVLQPPQSLVV